MGYPFGIVRGDDRVLPGVYTGGTSSYFVEYRQGSAGLMQGDCEEGLWWEVLQLTAQQPMHQFASGYPFTNKYTIIKQYTIN